MADLKKALMEAGFKESSPAKKKEITSGFKQCRCGAILNKDGLCKACDYMDFPRARSVLCKRQDKKGERNGKDKD